ncbi:MAG: GNAT family N-acetyltransferase [Acidimicrobiales bacterium]|nr:GNAT family N-acetyltransferase [Acidimicrobiales bacterium]MDG1876334.1 GNAT family N-acetyltransferase [Acidimicrobiales bacterium]
MGMYALTVDNAWVRAGSWRGSSELAYLVPLSGATTLTPEALARIRGRLRENGFTSVVTAAVGPSERDVLEADGFTEHERLHLLRCDLRSIPDRPSNETALRRAWRSDRPAILNIDAKTFEPFWQLDLTSLLESIRATPAARVRVISDPTVVGYAVTGRSGTQGYLQRLAVDPSRQGEGLGIALVADGLQWLRRRNANVCWVNTQEANTAALSLYEKLSFVPASHQLTVLQRDL